jgi:hypothetical protein
MSVARLLMQKNVGPRLRGERVDPDLLAVSVIRKRVRREHRASLVVPTVQESTGPLHRNFLKDRSETAAFCP